MCRRTPAILFLGLTLLTAAACGQTEKRPATEDARPVNAPPSGVGPIVVLRPEGRQESRVRVRLARTPAQRQRGLMYVEDLPPGEGMLFVFDEDEVQEFWMRNTFIPLDMIFIDSSWNVVGVVEKATPRTDTLRSVGVPSRYVLEVIGGWSRAQGIDVGTRVELENVKL